MRILIINTQSVNHDNATGITLRSILRNLPIENLYELYMQPCVGSQDFLPLRSEQLPAAVCPIRHIANSLMTRSGTGEKSAAFSAAQKTSFGSHLKTFLAVLLDYEPVFITPSLIEKIKDFHPDCIYTLGNSIDTMKLCVEISEKFQISIVPHFMDNWQASHRFGADRYKLHVKKTQKWLAEMYQRSQFALAISEKMAYEYQIKWEIPHYPLMNTVDVEAYHTKPTDKSTSDIKLVYAGGLHLNRYKPLLDIAHVIEQCSIENNEIELLIYTDEKSYAMYGELFGTCRHATFCKSVPHEQIIDVYKSADVLIHIESFDKQQQEFIRYSLSTKISEYLATGKPILLYAPSDIFVSEYLSQNDAAITVSKCEDLKKSICELKNREKMKTIASHAYELAKKYHDNSYIKEILSSLFG